MTWVSLNPVPHSGNLLPSSLSLWSKRTDSLCHSSELVDCVCFPATFGLSPFANLDSRLALVVVVAVLVDPHKKKTTFTHTHARTHARTPTFTSTAGFQLTPLARKHLVVCSSLSALTGLKKIFQFAKSLRKFKVHVHFGNRFVARILTLLPQKVCYKEVHVINLIVFFI